MPKIIRKNTKRAIRKHEQHKQQLNRRDSIASSLSITSADKNVSSDDNSRFYSNHNQHRYRMISKYQMCDINEILPTDNEQYTRF